MKRPKIESFVNLRNLWLWLLVIVLSCKPSYHYFNPYERTESTVIYPFQVIYADSVRIEGKAKLLKTYDLIRSSEKVIVHGKLLLAHYSGEFLAFEEDTVDIEQINLTIIPREIDGGIVYGDGFAGAINTPEVRPNLSHLFEKFPHRRSHPVTDIGYLEFSHPHGSTVEINRNQEICIRWWTGNRDASTMDFFVLLKNIFDETIDSIAVHGNTYKAAFGKYEGLKEARLIILRVGNIGEEKSWTKDLGIRIGARNSSLTDVCDIESPIEALKTAYFLEYLGDLYGAREMYSKASAFQNHHIYDSLLTNFEQRYTTYFNLK
jgi:hypothetical protein